MKIPEKNHIVSLEAYIQKVNSGKKVGEQGDQQKPLNGVQTGEEKVQLSTRAKDIQRVKNIINTVPDIRTEKVNQLKRSIEDGTYNVKGEKVAEKMIKESLLDEIL